MTVITGNPLVGIFVEMGKYQIQRENRFREREERERYNPELTLQHNRTAYPPENY